MMKLKTIFIFFLVVITSCRSSFHGTIGFKTTIESDCHNSETYKDYKQRYGDTLVIKYQPNGDMIRNHKNGLINYQKYSAERGEIYFVYHDSEIDTFNANVSSLKRIRKTKTADETIIGEPCNCYQYISVLKSNNDTAKIEACYPKNKKKYKLNYRKYKNYKDYYILELYKQNKVPYFKYHIHYPPVSILYDGVSVTY